MTRVARSTFESAISSRAEPHERIAIFGALLAKDVGPRFDVIVTGGSAVSIWTHGAYVSGDIDVVGLRSRIVPVLARWGFTPDNDPDGRQYWSREDLQLAVDIINRKDYSGNTEWILTLETPFGSVKVAAVEDLIVRRLVFWNRDGKDELLDQAVALFADNRSKLDSEYLMAQAKYEEIDEAYEEMVRLADAAHI
jgi:hypothetical protein